MSTAGTDVDVEVEMVGADPAEDRNDEETDDRARVLDAAHRCVDLLVRTAIIDGSGRPTWPTWEMGPDGPLGVVAGRRSLYDGDAGVVWALTRLGTALHRPDAAELAASGVAALRQTRPTGEGAPAGLLVGEAGVDLLGRDGRGSTQRWSDGSDLTDGLAGILLSLAQNRRREDHAARIVAELRDRSRAEVWGRSWPDHRLEGDAARPLCGLAHGASGVAWALAEAAAVWPSLASAALELADEALAWESTWSEPARGGWPDLREGDVTWPDLWCHGAAGAGAVRLRLLELDADGLDVPWSLDTTRAEAELAVQRCGRAMSDAAEQAVVSGVEMVAGGWTLCHGAGGPAGVVSLAADVFDVPEHRAQAMAAAAAFVSAAPVDPGDWPSGLRGADGDVSLLTGVAGTAVLLADLALPGSVPALVLLGAGGVRAGSGAAASAPAGALASAPRGVSPRVVASPRG
ncbi:MULTISPECIES: lanthionine synthetase LanC family protein [unclassified Knoellia]|uniref:lanthionine synthetase LanC family protein n=1 Tax=Knoellia altitudinis TaxID=3404795 RepID=UPI00361B4B8E